MRWHFMVPAISILMFIGCGRKSPEGKIPEKEIEPASVEAQRQVSPAQEVLSKVDEHVGKGEIDQAVAVLEEAMADESYAKDKGWLFSSLIYVLLNSDRVDDAREKYMSTIPDDEPCMRAAFGMINRHYEGKKAVADLEIWTRILVDAQMPKDLAEQALGFHLSVLFRQKKMDEIVVLIPSTVERFDPRAARRVVDRLTRTVIRAKMYDDADMIIDAIDKVVEGEHDVQRLITVFRIELMALRAQWSELERAFTVAATTLPDSDVRRCLQIGVGAASRGGSSATADRMCEFVIREVPAKKASVRTAAGQWMTLAKQSGKIGRIQERLESLVDYGMTTDLIGRLYNGHAYEVMKSGTKKDVAKLVAFGDSLLSGVSDENLREQLKGVILDGAFIADDYARALRVLEDGLADRTPEWHAMAKNKVGAHLALQEGRPQDAIDAFRRFMSFLEKQEEQKPQQDPTTGIEHSLEMILGRNAKRIGDIYTGMGDKKNAVAAYKEARGYYNTAKRNLEPDSDALKVVEEEAAAIPSG